MGLGVGGSCSIGDPALAGTPAPPPVIVIVIVIVTVIVIIREIKIVGGRPSRSCPGGYARTAARSAPKAAAALP